MPARFPSPHRPLPAHERRDLQLKHHLALSRLRGACRDPAPLAVLANIVRLSWQLRDVASLPNLAPRCDRTERALERAFMRGAPYRLAAGELDALAQLLALHDAQLDALTIDRYLDAWAAVRRAATAPATADAARAITAEPAAIPRLARAS